MSLTSKEPEINKLLSVVSGQCDKIQKNTIPTGVHTAKGPNLPQARKKEANPITKLIMEWSLVDIQKVMKIICTHTANFIPLLQMVLKHSLKLALFNNIKLVFF